MRVSYWLFLSYLERTWQGREAGCGTCVCVCMCMCVCICVCVLVSSYTAPTTNARYFTLNLPLLTTTIIIPQLKSRSLVLLVIIFPVHFRYFDLQLWLQNWCCLQCEAKLLLPDGRLYSITKLILQVNLFIIMADSLCKVNHKMSDRVVGLLLEWPLPPHLDGIDVSWMDKDPRLVSLSFFTRPLILTM